MRKNGRSAEQLFDNLTDRIGPCIRLMWANRSQSQFRGVVDLKLSARIGLNYELVETGMDE